MLLTTLCSMTRWHFNLFLFFSWWASNWTWDIVCHCMLPLSINIFSWFLPKSWWSLCSFTFHTICHIDYADWCGCFRQYFRSKYFVFRKKLLLLAQNFKKGILLTWSWPFNKKMLDALFHLVLSCWKWNSEKYKVLVYQSSVSIEHKSSCWHAYHFALFLTRFLRKIQVIRLVNGRRQAGGRILNGVKLRFPLNNLS